MPSTRFLVGVALAFSIAGCSLLTNFSGLTGGAVDAGVFVDAASNDAARAPSDGGTDATTADALSDAFAADADADAIDASVAPDASPADAGADAQSTYASRILGDHPLGYWRLDDPVGSISAHDEIAGHDGNVVGPVTFGVAGVAGTAATFTQNANLEVGDYFDFSDNAPYSFEFWAMPVYSREYENVIARSDMTAGVQYVAYFNTEPSDAGPTYTFFSQYAWTGAQTDTGESFATHAGFLHCVVTFDVADGPHVYVDDIESGRGFTPGADASAPPAPNGSFTISSGYIGALDEVAVYGYALTHEQVDAHYRAGHVADD